MVIEVAVLSAIDITIKILLLARIKAAQKVGYEVHGLCTKGPNFEGHSVAHRRRC